MYLFVRKDYSQQHIYVRTRVSVEQRNLKSLCAARHVTYNTNISYALSITRARHRRSSLVGVFLTIVQ